MIDLAPPQPRTRPEPVLPMVNLVFLLLIFFLIAAVIAPSPPLAVEAPRATAVAPFEPASRRLALSAAGEIAYDTAHGPAALAALAAEIAGGASRVVALHVDRRTPAARTVAVVRSLAGAGAGPVWLVVEPVR